MDKNKTNIVSECLSFHPIDLGNRHGALQNPVESECHPEP